MAKSKPTEKSDAALRPKNTKLPILPKNARITKRPLLHLPIASARAGSHLAKIVYVSSNTPFVSTIKRVRKLLSEVDKRSMGPVNLSNKNLSERKISEMIGNTSGNGKSGRGEQVFIKGTGRAIENALQVGLYFQNQDDCLVQVRTGSVGTVDDITVTDTTGNGGEEEVDVPETRVRRTSTIEVLVSLK